jgi:hypothetical protein
MFILVTFLGWWSAGRAKAATPESTAAGA